MTTRNSSEYLVQKYGSAILQSHGMQLEKTFLQHGTISVYDHSVAVAILCVKIASNLPLQTDTASLVRGALLHDYFLYDWHIADKRHRFHGFRHAKFAHQNALNDFQLNHIEENMILSHMFPLNVVLPRYRESIILCIADKLCAMQEVAQGLLHL